MTARSIQPSFAGGELAPALHGRVDIAKYSVGLKTCRNFIVQAQGGVCNRPGTIFVAECRDSTKRSRLIPFQFSTVQGYVLEFGDQCIRVIKDDGLVLETAKNITGATAANPVVITSNSHGFSNGDQVYIAGVGGMTQLNGNTYTVAGATTNTFELSGINGSGYTAYTSGGTASRIYRISSPYLEADLQDLKFTQSADVLTIVHPSYAPRDLTRSGHANWTLSTITFAPSISAPASVTVTPTGGASTTYNYKVTALKSETLEESVGTIGTTSTGPATLSTSAFNTVTWASVSGAQKYNVYREKNGLYGLIGSSEGTSFKDEGSPAPDFDDTPPAARNPFPGANDYPGCVAYHEQRRFFSGTNNKPDTIYGSGSGAYNNFNVSTPTRDDDAVTWTIVSNQVNAVRHMVSLRELVILTTGAEWTLRPGQNSDALTPSSVSVKPQSYRGCSQVPPVVIGSTVLFVGQEPGTDGEVEQSVVRDLGYSFSDDAYIGNDVSMLSAHLFEGRSIQEWAYQQRPWSVLWAVRDDGVLLGLTYVREHEVWAWHRHDSDGEVESVAVISEAGRHALYLTVKRRLGGTVRRCIERLASRHFEDVRDAFFVDCGLSLDSPVAISGATAANPVVVTATSHGFVNGDEVDIVEVEGMTELNGLRFTVANKTSNTFELSGVNGSAYTAYIEGGQARKAVTTITGLQHLNGETVAVLADGSVVTPQVVTSGAITLPAKASRVHVGLPFTSDLQTLDIELNTRETTQGRLKRIVGATVRLLKSRGFWFGPDEDHLFEYKQRTTEAPGQPIALLTGDSEMLKIDPLWTTGVSLFIRQTDPLPLNVLAIIPRTDLGNPG